MFAATTKKSFLLTDIAKTCDVLEEAVNIAFEGRPGTGPHPRPREPDPRGVEVENYHDIDSACARPARPGARRGDRRRAGGRNAEGKTRLALVGFGAIRSGAGAEIKAADRAFQIPLLTTLDGKGIVSTGIPLAVGRVLRQRSRRAWKAFREADIVLSVGNSLNQHATFNYREDLFEDKMLIHVNIAAGEIDKAYKADYALVSERGRRSPPSSRSSASRSGSRRGQVDGTTTSRHITHLTADPPRRARADDLAMLPENAILLADAGAHLAWLGYYVELKGARTSERPAPSGRWPGTSTAPSGEVRPPRPDRRRRLRRRLLPAGRLRADDRRRAQDSRHLGDLQRPGIQADQALPASRPIGESGLVEFQNPDFAAYARACGADGYRVETLEEFEDAFRGRSPPAGLR